MAFVPSLRLLGSLYFVFFRDSRGCYEHDIPLPFLNVILDSGSSCFKDNNLLCFHYCSFQNLGFEQEKYPFPVITNTRICVIRGKNAVVRLPRDQWPRGGSRPAFKQASRLCLLLSLVFFHILGFSTPICTLVHCEIFSSDSLLCCTQTCPPAHWTLSRMFRSLAVQTESD